MKTYLIAALLILAAVLPIGSQNKPQGTHYADSRILFRETMAAGAGLVGIMEQNDLEVVKVDMDLVGLNNPKQSLKKMSAAFEYVISAVGQPSRIADLDLEVYYIGPNGTTTLVNKDTEVDNAPSVTFKPYVDGTYMIVIKAAKMVEGWEGTSGFYFMVIAHN